MLESFKEENIWDLLNQNNTTAWLLKTLSVFFVLLAAIFLYFHYNVFYKAKANYSNQKEMSMNNVLNSTSVSNLVVEISGAVEKPGVYEVSPSSRVVNLISLSGGLVDKANFKWVHQNLNLASFLDDGEKIYIPFDGEEYPANASRSMTNNTKDIDKISVNANNSSLEELKSLPGIGDSYAQLVTRNRPYKNIDDFYRRSEIPKKTIEKIESYLVF